MKKENKSWNYGRFIVVISILFAFLYSCKYMIAKSPILNTEQVFLYGRIISVIDGDTVKIQFTNNGTICHETETVRLVGVNCPELNLHKDAEPEPYAIEARDYTNQFYQSEVIFYFDDVSDKRDKYSRLLGYVLLDNGKMLNCELIMEGLGVYYSNFKFESKTMELFELAEENAKKNKKGMWSNYTEKENEE